MSNQGKVFNPARQIQRLTDALIDPFSRAAKYGHLQGQSGGFYWHEVLLAVSRTRICCWLQGWATDEDAHGSS